MAEEEGQEVIFTEKTTPDRDILDEKGSLIKKGAAEIAERDQEECPICFELRGDVQQLVHHGGETPARSQRGLDVSAHRACGVCRQQLLEKNQSCPWCRERMEWQDIFGFLDGLKSAIGRANAPDELADLMSNWQEYEMTRSQADVRTFARDMVEDVGLCAHLDQVLASKNVAFMRDSAGLWSRFHAMVVDGELQVHAPDAERLERLVRSAMEAFEADGGGAPQHVGAMYTQLAVAVLCAQISGSSTSTLVQLARRTGEACVRLHRERYRNVGGVRERLPEDYASAVSDLVWGGPEQDIVVREFFGPGSDTNPPAVGHAGGIPAGGFDLSGIDLSGLQHLGIHIPAGFPPPEAPQPAVGPGSDTNPSFGPGGVIPAGGFDPSSIDLSGLQHLGIHLPAGVPPPAAAAEAAEPPPQGATASAEEPAGSMSAERTEEGA